LLVRDFTEERTYKAVTEKLDYLDSLGINAIELMPVNEFEGNLSWGYNPSYKFAPDKFYGTEDDLRELIDEAHKRGIAIIFDMVLNHHFGRSPLVRMYSSGDFGPPRPDNPWFNVTAKHDFNVGYDFNHESQYTKDYVDRVVAYWVEKYKVDGYRFDLSKGFTQKNTLGNTGAWGQYDASRIALLKRMADVIWAQDPETYIILEHFADNNEETELADYGMMLWGNMNHDYRKAAKAQNVNLNWAYYGARG
jgi:1,4-alpha-glucan branching enzyme